jgi:hypothetical protein
MKSIVCSTILLAGILFLSLVANAQIIRQTSIAIDDSSGNFTILKAGHGGGTVTMPSGTGTLSFGSGGSGGVNLQASTPGTAQTGNINVDGTIVADSIASSGGIAVGSITTTGAIAAKTVTTTGSISGGNITATGKLNVTGITTLTSLVANLYVDNTGSYACDSRSTPDFTVIETSNGGFVGLPSSPVLGRIIAVKFANSTGGLGMTVSGGSSAIDGLSSYHLSAPGGSQPSGIIVVFTGANGWCILGSH